MLDSKLSDLGVTPAQCHVLIELGHHGVRTARELCDSLQLDKSGISRVLSSLKRAELISERDATDRRKRPLVLSTKGKQKLRRIHDFADGQVKSALDDLSEETRQSIVEGMANYARALQRARSRREFEIRPCRADDDPDIAGIIRRVMPEYGAEGPGYAINDPEVDHMSQAYRGKRAAYYVVTREGRVVGGGGFAPLAGGEGKTCELRKMYFLPEARGHGVGRQLLVRVLEQAKAAGFTHCYLETLEHMTRARALYRSLGFQPLDKPRGATGHFGCDSWMLLEL
ncbi:MAG: GNAT family N-acetyltransferase [Polyangiaceae bacterium]|nr:GNAT family N-acetyltransferase [Myxococcales bacterium]MCB9589123.1 GNAT family N-acetyltransferase [Polyangiaceae bacterium]